MHVCICEPQGELDQGALRSRMRPSWARTWFHSRCDQDTRISEEQQVALLDCPDQWVYPPTTLLPQDVREEGLPLLEFSKLSGTPKSGYAHCPQCAWRLS